MPTRKPFTHIILCMELDSHTGMRLTTLDPEGVDMSHIEPRMNEDDAENRRAMYAVAGILATFGHNVRVELASDVVGGSMYDRVVIEPTLWVSTRDCEEWELDVRQCVDEACRQLRLEYVG